jgi:16S rRNA processing protein RimM
VLGRVVGAHGLHGEIRIRFLGEDPRNLVGEVGLARDPEEAHPALHEVRRVRGGSGAGELVVELDGIEDRDTAEGLRGCWVLLRLERLPALPEGEHYWHELVGCRVETTGGERVGTVRELWETGGHDLLVVEDESARRYLVPTAPDLMREVDVAGRRIVIEPVPGLLEPVENGEGGGSCSGSTSSRSFRGSSSSS